MIIPPNFARPGVIAGFALTLPASGLVPTLGLGALVAQGTLWVPVSAPAVPAATVSAFRYLAYNISTGLYWTSNPAGTTAGDAVLGWAEANATDLIAVSNQFVQVGTVAASSGGTSGVGGGGSSLASTSGLRQVFVSSTPYAVAVDDDVVTFLTGSAVANLPHLTLVLRHPIWFINASASTVTVNPFAGDTLEGASSISLTPGSRYQVMPNA
jgi:hypothetical protein